LELSEEFSKNFFFQMSIFSHENFLWKEKFLTFDFVLKGFIHSQKVVDNKIFEGKFEYKIPFSIKSINIV